MGEVVIKIGKEIVKIEARPLNIIITAPTMLADPELEYPGCAVLKEEYVMYHAERVQRLHPEFDTAMFTFLNNTTPAIRPISSKTADEYRACGRKLTYVMGLIDMSLKIMDRGVPVVWVHPEGILTHPGWQVGLGDLSIWFMDRGKRLDEQEKKAP
jgi:hypothetical protein